MRGKNGRLEAITAEVEKDSNYRASWEHVHVLGTLCVYFRYRYMRGAFMCWKIEFMRSPLVGMWCWWMRWHLWELTEPAEDAVSTR
ncbi:hypothetical protein TSMEX_003789 [Taenia solium]|eukprot:TsM_000081600 transcript=TsM_000081600 gene=TsM_000081600